MSSLQAEIKKSAKCFFLRFFFSCLFVFQNDREKERIVVTLSKYRWAQREESLAPV